MSSRKEPAPAGEAATPDVRAAHPDLRALMSAVRRRDRQLVVARLLVEGYARADGEDASVAWRRFRRAIEIEHVSALPKGELRKADVASLMADIDAALGPAISGDGPSAAEAKRSGATGSGG